MQNAEKHKYLHNNQHSGWTGGAAIDIVLRKTFSFETFHFQWSNFGCTDCDAKACYDQIIPIVLLLAYYKAGLPYLTCVFLMILLYNMQYYIVTAFGTAKFVNTYHLFQALFGIGQGSTDGPPGWTCIVDPILKCYNKMAHGYTLICLEQKISAKVNANMFVNDVT
eukprot:2557520-Ditylum_brightwellii.AAC.1